ncbi:MAG: peptide-methionine (R)-S-oxide reductase MsrB [Acidimicrobiaceae bacterium]|nr:peptide-methionine (R)-S-oxide reductase MsrB [Acidimicrobiaceae bacterium]MCY4175777.1 peptide-methionine (R)-S-oxide reductase MsrB [Acidimicrobiaceae bacterium]MCY4280850.1 peptide-methionine (R)-S-oxide reductase MsrB [Acidimicrobiaceae bacterium]MCY4293863.1 peptide-methionine (R)-S-oxide reductase MsrB [Acidimicrobiaceae bacterium]
MISKAVKAFSKSARTPQLAQADSPAPQSIATPADASNGSAPDGSAPDASEGSVADGGAVGSFDDAELRQRLSSEQYHVTQKAGTERAFTGVYWDCHDAGTYRCIVCDAPLFSSNTKYDSGTGWPSFWEAIDPDAVEIRSDRSWGMIREEAVCARCGAHLGHRFNDGPNPTGERYCMNSASLRLDPSTD